VIFHWTLKFRVRYLFSAARWKIPATYTIVEIPDFTFAESTNTFKRKVYEKRIENLLINTYGFLLV
jgi:hypothetical protein